MARPKGYQRAKLLRGQKQGGTPAPDSDGIDRSQPESMAFISESFLIALAVKNYSERTVGSRRHSLKLFLMWAQERDLIRPESITKSFLESYQRYLWHYRKKDGKALSVGTQIGRLSTIRQFFKWLYKEGYIEADPAAHLEMPKEERRLPQDTLSETEVANLLAQPDITDPLGIRDRTILELLYSTGIRRTEITRLELRDLSTERGTLFIRKGKGGKDRIVPIGKRALQWAERYLGEVRPLLQLDLGERALFLTGYGAAFTPNSLGNLVTKIVRQALGNRGSCHLLRHACATHMMEHGADTRVIQQLLGHAKLETTQIYTEVSIKLLQEVHARTHPTASES